MKLTIIGEDNVLEQEVNSDMEVQDVLALIAAEVSQRNADMSVLPLDKKLITRPSCPKNRSCSQTTQETRFLKGIRHCKATA